MEPRLIDDVESRFIDVDGISTHFYEGGQGDPLILIHGGGAGADAWGNWRGCIHYFMQNFHVYAVDMIGFGHTDKPSPDHFSYTQDSRVKHITGFIDTLSLSNVNLIGNSMGGITSMGVAIEHPDKIKQIVLMGSAGVRMAISDELKSIMNYDYTVPGMERIVRGLTNPDFAVDPDIVAYRHELSIQEDTKHAYNAIMGWLKEQGGLFYEEDYIARVSCPAFVVNGKLDKVVPLECAYRLLELIDDSTGYILPHCGHWAMIEHPQEFASAATHFLLAN